MNDTIPAWRIHPDGSIWEKGKCFGHPPGSCQNDHDPDCIIYCRECEARYDDECDRERSDEQRKAIVTEALGIGALPPHFRHWQPNGLKAWQANAMNTINLSKACVWISDKCGTGKTELCLHIVMQAMKRGVKSALLTGEEIIQAKKDYNCQRAMTTYPLMVIDDLNKAYFSEYGCAHLHQIFDARHRARLRTIVTAEVGPSDVARMIATATSGKYGQSTIDRLSFPKMPCVTIEMRGENLRR